MLQAIEFFSGIGGMHYALDKIAQDTQVIASYDISPLANIVYSHNFKRDPIQVGIDHLSVHDLNKLHAHIYLLSPPCQPYTRAGKMLDMQDPRAQGLHHLLNLLQQISLPPQYLFLENVVNFEKSSSRDLLVQVLQKMGYSFQEFILSPTQFGIPNERPRYYLCASRNSLHNATLSSEIRMHWHESFPMKKISDYLDSKFVDSLDSENLFIPSQFFQKRSWINELSITCQESTTSCCFTKAYGSFGLRSGSYLRTTDAPITMELLNSPVYAQKELGLRFFSPSEVARLLGFPIDNGLFTFPCHLSMKQKWRLLGNSMSVDVVAILLEFLIHP